MPRPQQFRLPDLGEGLTEGEILRWLVQLGDQVRLNQPIVEVETAKAAVEVPSPYAGVVSALHVQAGETVDVGTPILTIDTEPGPGPGDVPGSPGEVPGSRREATGGPGEVTGSPSQVASDAVPAATAALVDGREAIEGGALTGEPTDGRTATLVGYGPRAEVSRRRRRKPPAPPPPEPPPAHARIAAGLVGEAAAVRVGRSAGGVPVLAKPPVRKLAGDLGVDLGVLHGSGPDGIITRADVQAAAVAVPVAPGSQAPGADPQTRERRIPVNGVRRRTAAAMVASAFTAPHVTEFITLDITPTMELRARVASRPEFRGVHVTPLLFVAKALLLAVRRSPEINSTFGDEEIVVKDYVNLGIAAATPRGLIVPNIKDADALDLLGLARALQSLTETARQGRTSPADLQRGTITITNVGTFGIDTGTPILAPGESAILCLGAVRPMPWVVAGPDGSAQVRVRQVTQLSLSFDHRNIDGQLGSQFLADIAAVLSEPETALLW